MRNDNPVSALILHGPYEAFDNADTSMLSGTAVPGADSLALAPAPKVLAPENSVLVANDLILIPYGLARGAIIQTPPMGDPCQHGPVTELRGRLEFFGNVPELLLELELWDRCKEGQLRSAVPALAGQGFLHMTKSMSSLVPGAFMAAYTVNRDGTNALAIESSPAAPGEARSTGDSTVPIVPTNTFPVSGPARLASSGTVRL